MSAVGKTSKSGRFDASSLLRKHRELLALIALLEGLLSRVETTDADSFRVQAASLLERLMRELQAHFDAERMSLAVDFDDDPDLRSAFRELDQEHPAILEKFSRASAAVVVGLNVIPETVGPLLFDAIAAFRQHEEREAVLFAHGSEGDERR